jgi:hypothetical protein
LAYGERKRDSNRKTLGFQYARPSVFVTCYRKKVLDGKAIEILWESFGGICRMFEAELIETSGAEDHALSARFLPAQGGLLCPDEQSERRFVQDIEGSVIPR